MIRLSYKSSIDKSAVLTLLSLLGATVFIFVAIQCSPEAALLVGAFIAIFLLLLWASYRREATEVFDCGEALLVRRGHQTERIPLADIESIKLIRGKQPVAQITLVKPGTFGKHIEFFDTHQTRAKALWGPCQSDQLIALRARIENTSVQALRQQEKKDMRPWGLVPAVLFIGFLVVNAPAGPIESLRATVLESHPGAKQTISVTMRMDDGSTFQVSTKQSPPLGASFACTRQYHRVTRNPEYNCAFG